MVLLTVAGAVTAPHAVAAPAHKKHPKSSHTPEPQAPSLMPPPMPAAQPAPAADTAPNPSPTASPDASSPGATAPVTSIQSDGHDVWGTTRAIGQAVRQAYAKLGRNEAFHRVALPYLIDRGDSAAARHMGQVVTEMLAVDLAQTAPFVILDRSRLIDAMGQNHLSDLHSIDLNSAVTFGHLLGAQTLLTGSIEATGDNYVVHVRQLDVQSGRVVLDGEAVMAGDALEATAASVVVERSSRGAVWRSALFPGWGQAYLQQPQKGLVFAGGAAVSLLTATGFYVAAAYSRSAYLRNTASTVGDRELTNGRLLGGNIALSAYAAIWLVNLADIYLSAPPSMHVELSEP